MNVNYLYVNYVVMMVDVWFMTDLAIIHKVIITVIVINDWFINCKFKEGNI